MAGQAVLDMLEHRNRYVTLAKALCWQITASPDNK
jgi:hypothetical protein